MTDSRTYKNPSWWTDSHSSGWERTKEAMRRDWEQTKADVSDSGQELNQDVGDTVKQAAGKQAIPPGNAPNPPEWDDVEPALRYGYGARQHYASEEWNDDIESRLRKDWDSSSDGGNSWDRFKSAVRRGWDSVKRAAA